eukprot:Sdes_comp19377_c0_seq2m10646
MVSMETDVVATYSSNPVDISARATPSSGLSQTLLVNNIFSDQLLSSSYRASSAHSGQDDIYCLFREKTLDVVKKSEFLAELNSTGLWVDDPRLKESMSRLSKQEEIIPFSEFKNCLKPNIYLIDRAIQGDFVIEDFVSFCHQVDEIFQEASSSNTGENASYIPQLARIDPNLFGVSLCTVDGQRHSAGDAAEWFTIQALCMPILYALAMMHLGEDVVHTYVGHEPSGVDVSEIVLNDSCQPHNPLINGGAILLSSLIHPEMDDSDRFDFVMKFISKLAGGAKVGFDNQTYLSERVKSDRNYALAHFMKEKGAFKRNVKISSTLEFYFQICCMTINCEAMAVISGVFSNGGICPITGEEIIEPRVVRNVLSVMYSCGMYNNSGEFAFSVGLPAKGAITGATMIVVPNVMGFCVWSSRLDSDNNSVRGLSFCKGLVAKFNFHNYDNLIQLDDLRKSDPRKKNRTPLEDIQFTLISAACSGDFPTVRKLFLRGVDLNEGDYDGRTALHLSASENRCEIADFLLSSGVEVNPLDRWGRTPYDDAMSAGNTEVLMILQKYGGHSSSDAKDDGGTSETKLQFSQLVKTQFYFSEDAIQRELSLEPFDEDVDI